MSASATVTLAHHGLHFRCPAGNLHEERPFSDADTALLQKWAERHQALARAPLPAEAELLILGSEMARWLDGEARFLTRAFDFVTAPVLIEFAVGRLDESPKARAFLDAPWELLAGDTGHWAVDPARSYCPVRRIGVAADPPKPSVHRLGVVFMASAPRGANNLDYEAEEASILKATQYLGIDLAVEESGTLDFLAACVAREQPEIVQVSCHGTLTPEPGLLLEDEFGDPKFARASALISKLGGSQQNLRLFFLSACETAQAHPVLDSLARTLVRAGAPAVVGWGAPVLDIEATRFAAALYARLVRGEDLAQAQAGARLDLFETFREQTRRSRDWHLPRLYLGPTGGGVLATAGGRQRYLGQGHAVKTFLDTKGQRVPVAGELEFVGRRREIQRILREIRARREERRIGVLIHGVGRQGKSSLAARVARRLEHTHETVVIFGRYDAPYILSQLRGRLGSAAVSDLVNRYLPLVEQDPANLLPALNELLDGPCAQGGDQRAKPVLLVVDDFEQAVNEQDRRTLRPECFEAIRCLLLAFQGAATESHLIFTSRFQFTCPHEGRDLADPEHLLDLSLHGMDQRESQKQAKAKLRSTAVARTVEKLNTVERQELESRIPLVIENARGNPGLQDLLFTLAVDNPAACDGCLAEMEEYLRDGRLPEAEQVRAFLEDVVLRALTGLLTPSQQALLRSATLFEVPVPTDVLAQLAAQTDTREADVARLLALGLLEIYEDVFDTQRPAAALNALVRPLAGQLGNDERNALAGKMAEVLFETWGGKEKGGQRTLALDYELARIGLLARNANVLITSGPYALHYLDERFEYRRAAAFAKEIVAVTDAAGCLPPLALLHIAAESCGRVGHLTDARAFRARALAASDAAHARVSGDRSVILLGHARALMAEGRPDDAAAVVEQLLELLPEGRDRAIVLGESARIRDEQGDVDGALKLHRERLGLFERLGENREKAIALGDIGGILARKGDLDGALQLHQERLGIFEGLNDKRERAVTLVDIARIQTVRDRLGGTLHLYQEALGIFESLGEEKARAVVLGDVAQIRFDMGDIDGALLLNQEALGISRKLDDRRSLARALADIAQIRVDSGKVDDALRLFAEALEIFESLGDKRSRAITLSRMACCRAKGGDVDGALQLHLEMLSIFEGLGDQHARAVTLGEVARIRSGKGDADGALLLHQERLGIFERLGDKRSRAVTLGDIAGIRATKGDVDGALLLHHDRLGIVEGLGDLDEKANVLWSIGQIEIEREQWETAFKHLGESYHLLLRLGRLDGISHVGLDLGLLLCFAGQREQGVALLSRSRDGFRQLGQADMVQRTERLLNHFAQT